MRRGTKQPQVVPVQRAGTSDPSNGGHLQQKPEALPATVTAQHATGASQPTQGNHDPGGWTSTHVWINLNSEPGAQEALDHIQETACPPPLTLANTAVDLILALHGWAWQQTITLHDKTGPPYSRTTIWRPREIHLEWQPIMEPEYTGAYAHAILVHAQPQGDGQDTTHNTPTPHAPLPQLWTVYRKLAHARTLSEASVTPYTDQYYTATMLAD